MIDENRGSLVLRRRPNKQGQYVIHLRYYADEGRYIYRSSGIWVNKEDWDPKLQQIKVPANPIKKRNEAIDANRVLASLKSKVDAKIRAYEGVLTYSVLENILDGNPTTEKEKALILDFFVYAEQVIDTFYGAGKFGVSVHENHLSNIRVFKRFIKHTLNFKSYAVADIRMEHIIQFIAYRRSVLENTSNQGIAKSIYPIKMVVKHAASLNLIDQDVANAILDISVNTKRTVYTTNVEEDDIKYLNPEELQKVCNFKATLHDVRRKRILDGFFFSVYTGLRFSDIMTLEWSHIQNDEIHKMQVKTKKEVVIPLTQSAMEILDSYRPNKTRFVFGFLEDDFDTEDPVLLQKARNSKNRTVNVALKTVARKSGIEPFSFHAARHSFAVMSLEQGVNIYLLSQIMGHSATEITSTYAKFLPNSLTKEVKEKMAFSFTPDKD